METRSVELSASDWQLRMTVSLPKGPMQLKEMLPFVRVLADAVVDANKEAVEEKGLKISCKQGCGACCRQLVAVSLVEAQALADLVAEMPPERRARLRSRLDLAIHRLEQEGILDRNEPKGARVPAVEHRGSREATLRQLSHRYFQLQIVCPFLENESCSIYEARPLVCREYHVTSPAERCAQLFEQPVDRVKAVFRIGDALTRTIEKILGSPAYSVPLVLALEWAEAHGDTLAQTHDSAAMFEILTNEIVESRV